MRLSCLHGQPIVIGSYQKRKDFVDIRLNDIIKLKKTHPCGSSEWQVLRVGADFRLKCMGCGHQIMIARRQLEKSVKEIKKD